MTPKLPVISGQQLIRALGHFGYETVRQIAMFAFAIHPIHGACP